MRHPLESRIFLDSTSGVFFCPQGAHDVKCTAMKKNFYIITATAWLLLWGAAFVFHPRHLPPEGTLTAEGYGGPIEMALSVSTDGRITGLKVLRHHETPSYIAGLESFLQQFTGKNRANTLVLGRDIDAISGATITSQAITSAVKENLSGQPAPPPPLGPLLAMILLPLVLTSLAVAALLGRHNALRWAALTGSFIYFGLVTHTMLALIQPLQAGLGHSPSFGHNPLWWMTLGIAFIGALVLGRIYCGSLCPFASVQEGLHHLARHRHAKASTVSPKLDRRTRTLKYIILLGITALCLVSGRTAAAAVEPFMTFFTGRGTGLAWAFLGLMLILSVFNFRFWCKYLCPVGALTSLMAAFSFWKIRPVPGCTACDDCQGACPVDAISMNKNGQPMVDNGECLMCAKCLNACPVSALKLTRRPR